MYFLNEIFVVMYVVRWEIQPRVIAKTLSALSLLFIGIIWNTCFNIAVRVLAAMYNRHKKIIFFSSLWFAQDTLRYDILYTTSAKSIVCVIPQVFYCEPLDYLCTYVFSNLTLVSC